MVSLIISDIPEELLQRLRKKAKQEQTTIQEQVILILNQNLQASPNFIKALESFYEKYPRAKEITIEEEDPFDGVRSQDSGRDVEL
jgi:hypothetical protein